jgi:hypothetical protein
MTSSATFLNPSKELIFSLLLIRTISTRFSCLIGLRASLLTSLGKFSSHFMLQKLVADCVVLMEMYRYPPDTDEKGKALGNFFQTTGAPPKAAAKVPATLKEIEAKYSSIKTWGVVGVSFLPCLPHFHFNDVNSSAGAAKSSLSPPPNLIHHSKLAQNVTQQWSIPPKP